MKILQLTHKPPVPSIDGGCLAMRQISNSLLSSGVELRVIAIETKKHPIVPSAEFTNYKENTNFESVFVNTNITIPKIVKSLLGKRSIHANRFYSKKMNERLKTLFSHEPFDVVIFESIFTGAYIPTVRKYSKARIIMRIHNIEHLIWRRLALQEKNLLKKLFFYSVASSLKRFECSLFKKIDGYIPITEVDNFYFSQQFPTLCGQVIPFGIDIKEYHYEKGELPTEPISFFHIGSMNWQPNKEGICWFLDNIWEKATAKYPNITLVLAGKGNAELFKSRTLKNVKVYDFVEDAQQFIKEHDIMLVPLLSGSGMRIKIMEGMALGKPIITTSIGAEGISVKDKENILIADSPEAMLDLLFFCIEHPEKCEEIGRNARQLIEDRYTQEKISKDLIAFLNTIKSTI